MAQEAPFARDLGYLDKFLAGLRTHAGGLGEPQRGELLALLDQETEHWARIKALLSGEAAPPAAQARPRSPAPASLGAPGWTVGSLMPGP